jgi:hypothetical protein
VSRPDASLHSLEADRGSIAATLSIGDEAHRITYQVEGEPLEPRYEPFLAATLPIAMRRASTLTVAGELSPLLVSSLPTVQDILHAWGDDLEPVEVEAEPGAPPPPGEGGMTAAFFSAGVDSFFTALRHRDSLSALIYAHGFDVPLGDRAKRERVSGAVSTAASRLGLPLIEVETDIRLVSNPSVRWGVYHGAALASVAHLLSARFERILIPATHAYEDLVPWGSHPLLDPLWSSEAVSLVHEGAVPRVQKLAELARSEVAMSSLRVCFQEGVDYNCGRCEKCLRTMAGLRAVGALERCETLPDRLSLRALARLPIRVRGHENHARRTLAVAEARGDSGLARALRRMLRHGRRRYARRRRYRDARGRAKASWRRLRSGRRRAIRRLRRRVAG